MKKRTYYTTSGAMPFSEFVQTEVNERANYSQTEVLRWMNKYRINSATTVIWVSPDPKVALSYTLTAEERENGTDPEGEPTEIQPTEGFIITESDDGDNGFLFVFAKEGKERK